MYLKLGSNYISYSTNTNDFLIFSEIIDSGMSYEKPILVRNKNELDIWFGNEYSEKDYLEELLKEGVTLFLYRPVNSQDNIYSDEYVNLENYKLNNNLFESISELPDIGEANTIYKLVTDNGEYIDSSTGLNYSHYIYVESIGYTKVSDLPQNMTSNNTMSLNNRDTLNLSYVGYEGPEYSYPIYRENLSREIENYSEVVNENQLMEHLPNLDRVLNKYDTLGFLLYFEDNINFKPEDELGLDTKYIILSKLNERILIWFKDVNNVIPSISSFYYDKQISFDIKNKSIEEIKNLFINQVLIKELEYNVELVEENVYKIYTSYNIPVTYFYNITGFTLEPRIDITHNILSKLLKNNTRIKFYSKTIGTDNSRSSDGNIKVNIEKLKGNDLYRITISRYDYYEVFEGGLFTLNGKRIDDIISSDSKLVYCELVRTYIDENGVEKSYKLDYSDSERNSQLPTGSWDLRRAVIETYDKKMYWKSVNSIFTSDEPIYIDFFLIPNIYNFTNGITGDYSYYPEYDEFLKLSTNLNCQILIQNVDNGWSYEKVDTIPKEPKTGIVYIYKDKYFILNSEGNLEETTNPEIINTVGNNFVFNYTKDNDNRLVYFFRPMKIYGKDRPGYYLHLLGLLSNIYSLTNNIILYDSPTKYPYELENIEELLEKYKSNYLVFNNHMYYYKKYQNGENFNTSIWKRFCIGKVYRELEKYKWKILGNRTLGSMEETINNILTSISGSFSFINSLELSGLYPDLQNNRLGMRINSTMSDLVDSNMTIDIILYYNKTNNY